MQLRCIAAYQVIHNSQKTDNLTINKEYNNIINSNLQANKIYKGTLCINKKGSKTNKVVKNSNFQRLCIQQTIHNLLTNKGIHLKSLSNKKPLDTNTQAPIPKFGYRINKPTMTPL